MWSEAWNWTRFSLVLKVFEVPPDPRWLGSCVEAKTENCECDSLFHFSMTLSNPAGISRARSKRDLLGTPHGMGKSVISSTWPQEGEGTMLEYIEPASVTGVKFVVDLQKITSQHSVKLFVNAFPAAPKISIYESKRRKAQLQNTARKAPQSGYKNSAKSFSRFVREQVDDVYSLSSSALCWAS